MSSATQIHEGHRRSESSLDDISIIKSLDEVNIKQENRMISVVQIKSNSSLKWRYQIPERLTNIQRQAKKAKKESYHTYSWIKWS